MNVAWKLITDLLVNSPEELIDKKLKRYVMSCAKDELVEEYRQPLRRLRPESRADGRQDSQKNHNGVRV